VNVHDDGNTPPAAGTSIEDDHTTAVALCNVTVEPTFDAVVAADGAEIMILLICCSDPRLMLIESPVVTVDGVLYVPPFVETNTAAADGVTVTDDGITLAPVELRILIDEIYKCGLLIVKYCALYNVGDPTVTACDAGLGVVVVDVPSSDTSFVVAFLVDVPDTVLAVIAGVLLTTAFEAGADCIVVDEFGLVDTT